MAEEPKKTVVNKLPINPLNKSVEGGKTPIHPPAKAVEPDTFKDVQAARLNPLPPKMAILKEHTLTPDDTLSALALHFYGHSTPEYWGLIIEANKAELGEDVKNYKPGKKIKIPVLPDSMKK